MRNMKWIALATTIGLFSITGCGSDSSTGSGEQNQGAAVAQDGATKPDATTDPSASEADVDAGKSSGGSGDLSIGGVDMPDDLDLDAKKGGIGSDVELTIEEPSDSAVDDIFGSVDDDLGLGGSPAKDPAAADTNDPAAADTNDPAATDTNDPAGTEPATEPESGASVGSDPFGADPFGAAPAPVKPEMRTWTNAAGTFSTEAVFVEFKEGDVYLTRKDGKPAKIPLAGLSQADQDYVKEIVAALDATGSEDSPE